MLSKMTGKLFFTVFFIITMMFSCVASAANMPVSDLAPQDLVAAIARKAADQGKNVVVSDAVNTPELSNIEGMDAWVSGVSRDNGSFIFTVQTQEEKIMALFMTVSFDSEDPENNTAANMTVAADFLPLMSYSIGLSEKEYEALFSTNFLEQPTGAVWCENAKRTIAYQCVINQDWKLVYFMVFASDKPAE